MPVTASTPLPWSDELDQPLTALFDAAAAASPDAVFLRSRSLPGETYTFGTFAAEARAGARLLVAGGIVPGDRVAVVSENRPRWCVAYAAVLNAAAAVVPVDAQADAASIARVLGDSGSRAVWVSAGLRARVEEAARATSLAILSLDDDGDSTWSSRLQLAPAVALPWCPGGDAPAAILYTSGTTGTPKGVVLTHRNLQVEVRSVGMAVRFSPDDRMLMFLPLQHVLSQVGSFLLPAAVRTSVVHANVARGEDLLAAVREEGVTILLAVPLLHHLLHERIIRRLEERPWPASVLMRSLLASSGAVRRHLGLNAGRLLFRRVHRVFGSRLRLLVSGGAALDPVVQRDFLALGLTLAQAYGLTETSGGATFDSLDAVTVGTVGRPLPGVTVRIHEPDPDGTGEVLLRGPVVTPGYHGRPEATADLVRDGRLHTGDLGRLDSNGRLTITGRLKDVIVLGSGKNVHPEDVEAHYARSPHVKEICVVARRRGAGTDTTDKLHAVIVPDWERLRADGISAVRDRIRFELETASTTLPSYQRVLSFQLRREPLPRTATRKLQRFLVQAEAEEMGEGELPAPPADEPEAARRLESPEGRAIVSHVRRRVGAQVPVRARSSFELDLGLDSLNRMELLLSVEASLGIQLTDDEAAQLATVDELIRVAQSKAPTGAGSAGEASSWETVVASATVADLPAWLLSRRGPLSTVAATGVVRVAALVGRALFRLRATGLEHLPSEGPYLICPNHVSWLDGFVVSATFPRRLVRDAFVFGEADYVGSGLVAVIARFLAVVPVDANRQLRQAMRVGAAGLKQGRVLLVFPEGVRSLDGKLQELRLGAPILAAELRVPIVPVVVDGSFQAWPRGQRWPRPRPITVRYGEPIDPKRVLEGCFTANERYRRMTDALRDGLLALGAPRGAS